MPQRRGLRSSRSRKRGDVEAMPLDLFHNRDTPCCRLLHDVAVEMRENRSTLANILWFLLQRQREVNAVSTRSAEKNDKGSLPIKKKKRKKKKKVAQDLEIPADDERKNMSTDVESGDWHEEMTNKVDVDHAAPALNLSISQKIKRDHFERFFGCLIADLQDQEGHVLAEHLPSLRPQLRTVRISHDKLLHALNDIACQSCRRSLEYFVAHRDQITLAQRQETTFDYVALEEGTLPCDGRNETVFRLLKPTSTGASWELHYNESNDHGILGCILDLTYEFVLAHGFSQDERMQIMGYKVIHLQTSAINSIRMSATSKYREIEVFLRDAKVEINGTSLECHGTEVHSSANLDYNFDAFPRLSEGIDKKLDIILQNLQRHVIHPLTKSYFAADVMLAMTDDALKQKVQELWYAYGQCIHMCVEHVAQYEGQFFLLANRHGVLPKHYLSTTARELYRSMLLQKIHTIHDLVERLEKICRSAIQTGISDISFDSQSATSFMYKLLLQHSFCEFLHKAKIEHSTTKLDQFDLLWDSFLESVPSFASTIHRSNVDTILQEHDAVREKVALSLKRAMSLVKAAHHISGNCPMAITSNIEQVLSKQRALLSGFIESMDRSQSLTSFRLSFGCSWRLCIDFWVDSRSSYQSALDVGHIRQRVQMPFELMKAMANDGEDALASCYEGMEENRIACILVSLFFRQLSFICDDWRATIAEQELLQSMSFDEKNILRLADSNTKTKSRPKSKRFVSPGSMQAEDSACLSSTARALVQDTVGNDPATVDTETRALNAGNKTEERELTTSKPKHPKCALTVDSVKNLSESHKFNSSHDESVIGEKGTIASVNISATTCIRDMPESDKQYGYSDKTEQTESETLKLQMKDLRWCGEQLEADFWMGVLDDAGGFQSARDFLVSRLRDLEGAKNQ